jgi:hypothetical protein
VSGDGDVDVVIKCPPVYLKPALSDDLPEKILPDRFFESFCSDCFGTFSYSVSETVERHEIDGICTVLPDWSGRTSLAVDSASDSNEVSLLIKTFRFWASMSLNISLVDCWCDSLCGSCSDGRRWSLNEFFLELGSDGLGGDDRKFSRLSLGLAD